MPVLNILCPICSEIFVNCEDIQSTSCGHVIHQRCLREWQIRSTNCPQCNFSNPTVHTIFLSFFETPETMIDMKDKLDKLTLEINELNIKLNDKDISLSLHRTDSEMQIGDLKEQIEASAIKLEEAMELISNLEETIASLNKYKDANVSLKQEILEVKKSSDSEIAALKKHIKMLNKQLQHTSSEVKLEISKNDKLSEECNNLKAALQTSADTEKIKELEQRLNLMAAEFENEITKSTQLEIDKVKLQSYINRMQLGCTNTKLEINETSESLNTPLIRDDTKISTLQMDDEHMKSYSRNLRKTNKSLLSSSESINSQQAEDSTANSIIIQNYPAAKLKDNLLEDIVIMLAKSIDIILSRQDIEKVSVVGRNRPNIGDRVSIFVRFSTKDIKMKFLSYKSRLSASSIDYLRDVRIKEFFDRRVQDIFIYAKAKLLGNGFNDIFYTNNKIFAKKKVHDDKGVQIYSCHQVDELLKSMETSENENV